MYLEVVQLRGETAEPSVFYPYTAILRVSSDADAVHVTFVNGEELTLLCNVSKSSDEPSLRADRFMFAFREGHYHTIHLSESGVWVDV